MAEQRIETDLRRLKMEGPEAGYLSIILVHAGNIRGTEPILFGMDIDCGCRIRNRIYSLAIAVTEGN
jgi:hypothetical protein